MLNRLWKKSELDIIRDQVLEYQPISSTKTLTTIERNQLIAQHLDRQNLFIFNYGPLSLGLVSVLSNSYIFYRYRRMFQVQKAKFVFYLLPLFSGLGTGIIYNAMIQMPLIQQRLHCFTCAFVKSQLNQMFHGVIFPTVAASTMSLFSAFTNPTVQLPAQVYANFTNFGFLAKYLFTKSKQTQVLNAVCAMVVINFALCFYVLQEQQNEIVQLIKIVDHKESKEEAL